MSSVSHSQLSTGRERDRALVWGIAALLIVLHVWLVFLAFDSFQVGVNTDDAEYVVLAESLVHGPHYGVISEIDAVGKSKYPFGWPLLLAPFYALTAGSLDALKLVSLALNSLVLLIVATRMDRIPGVTREHALGAAAILACSPQIVGASRMLMSEPSAAFATVALVVFVTTAPKLSFKRPAATLGAGFLCVLMAYTRTIGVVILLAIAVVMLWKRQHRELMVLATAAAVCLVLLTTLTHLRSTDLINPDKYLNQLLDPEKYHRPGGEDPMYVRAVDGLRAYTTSHIRDALVPFSDAPRTQTFLTKLRLDWILPVLSISTILMVVIGMVILVRSGAGVVALGVALFLATLSVWPWSGPRFLYQVLPLLLIALLIGVSTVVHATFGRFSPRLYLLVVVALMGLGALRSIRISPSLAHTVDLSLGATWIASHAAPDSVVLSDCPRCTYIYARRKTGDLSRLSALTAREGRDAYVLLRPTLVWDTQPSRKLSGLDAEIKNRFDMGQISGKSVFEDTPRSIYVYQLQ